MSEEIHFFMENVKSYHPISKSIVSSADGTENQNISTDSMEMDPHISQSCVISTENIDVQALATHSVQPVEIHLFIVKSGLYAALDPFVHALSSALLIVAVDFSQIRRSIAFYPATNMSNLGDHLPEGTHIGMLDTFLKHEI
jgi:hypothetical protein